MCATEPTQNSHCVEIVSATSHCGFLKHTSSRGRDQASPHPPTRHSTRANRDKQQRHKCIQHTNSCNKVPFRSPDPPAPFTHRPNTPATSKQLATGGCGPGLDLKGPPVLPSPKHQCTATSSHIERSGMWCVTIRSSKRAQRPLACGFRVHGRPWHVPILMEGWRGRAQVDGHRGPQTLTGRFAFFFIFVCACVRKTCLHYPTVATFDLCDLCS